MPDEADAAPHRAALRRTARHPVPQMTALPAPEYPASALRPDTLR